MSHGRNLAAGLLAVVLTACSSPAAVTTSPARPPSDELARRLHAATGHVPSDCFVFGAVEAVITIREDAIEPTCAVVRAEASLTVRNETDQAATFWVIDGADSAGPPHLRIEVEVPAGGDAVIDRLADHVSAGWYRVLTTERLVTHRGDLQVTG